METVLFSLLSVAIAGVVYWFYVNDGRPDDQPTIGLLAMRDGNETAKRSKNAPRQPSSRRR